MATSATPSHEDGRIPARLLAHARRLIQSGDFEEAEQALDKILLAEPGPDMEAEARYALAVSRRYRQDLDGAMEMLKSLVAIRPDQGRAYQEMGYCRLEQKQFGEAAEAFERAVSMNPALIASWRNLAALHDQMGNPGRAQFAAAQAESLGGLPQEILGAKDLFHEGKIQKAEQLCRRFLQANKTHIEGMRLLAEIGTHLRIYDDAEFLLESCVEFDPEHLGARMDYLKILNRKGKFQKALEQSEILLRSQGRDPGFRVSKAVALVGLGRFEEGIALYRECLRADSSQPVLHVMLGHAHKAVGSFEEAVASYREAYRLRPDYGDAYWSLANTKTYRFSPDEIEQLRRHAENTSVAADDRAHLLFAAGKAFEDREEFETSFRYYDQGNALKRSRSGYDPDKTTSMVDAQIEVCGPELFEERGNHGYPSADPIFIVGLPRAGSTLIEQILASHSMVDGTMELHEVLGLAQRLRGRGEEENPRYPRILRELDENYFHRFGEQYIEQTRVYRGNAAHFTDKMPNNFLHIGLIRLILPKAKIIDARRHPMACCFSGYKQLFGEGQDFSYGLQAIGQYYRDYVRLMDHWDTVLPGFVHRVVHEDLVEDLETQVGRLLEFCHLPFEQECLEFHRTRRSVRTPSSEQVRQPIYRSGLEQWRHYEPWLGPLKEALGADVRKAYGIV